ncbi:hypothetical protein JYT87_02805 [Nitrospira defluvii]|nr:hypothetical protein [Nitrospira defluvii]
MRNKLHKKMLMSVQNLSRDQKIIVGTVSFLYGGLTVCVLLAIDIPWIFASPNIFAVVLFFLVISTNILLKIMDLRSGYVVVFISSFFSLLLFPKNFEIEIAGGFLSSNNFYLIALALLGFAVIAIFFQSLLGRPLPKLLWGLIGPAFFLSIHLFFFPETSFSEIKMLTALLVIGSFIGFLWEWFREE